MTLSPYFHLQKAIKGTNYSMPCQIKNNSNLEMDDLQPHIDGMYDHFNQKLGFQKPPVIVFDSDPSNQSNVLGKTAYYDPQSLEVHIFMDGRHPKDMLRSIAHELIHHHQNMEGRLDVGGYNGPGYYLENDKMKKIEQEAMLKGNAILREYEDGLKLKEMNEMSLKEWKNNELNGLLLKKFGILKEQKEELEELTKAQEKLPPQLQKAIKDKEGKSDDKKDDSEDLDEGRMNAKTHNADKFVGHEDRYQADRIHEADEEELDEGQLCEKCGEKHVMKEEDLEEGGLADTPENSARASGRKEGGRYKRMQESIRSTLKESKKLRLRIKRK
jgi:hypothetical protein